MDKISQLVANNAAWIHEAVSALGKPGMFNPVLWQNTHDMPPIFPNADTLGGTEAEQLSAIAALAAARTGRVVAVKDAWARLDLTPLGFKPLFEAQWLYREVAPLEKAVGDLQLERVNTAEQLREFAVACNGEALADVYAPTLIRPNIVWILGRREGQIVGGVTAFAAEGLNAINNLFAISKADEEALIQEAINAFPELPAGGYEQENAIPPYLPLGFQTLGKLRVWVKNP